MNLEEAIENTKKRINTWENIAEIGKATLSKEEYENSQSICEEQKLLLEELEHLQKENQEYSKQLDLDYVDKNFVSKEKIMKYKKEAENAECKNTLEAVCIGAIIGVLDGLLEE